MVGYWSFIYVIYKGFGRKLYRLGMVDWQVGYRVDMDVYVLDGYIGQIIGSIYIDIDFYMGLGGQRIKKRLLMVG